jgi:tetratricopeptide (TPR) repeat protein
MQSWMLLGTDASPSARAAPGPMKQRTRIFSSRRRTRYWLKRCQRDKGRALRRADALQTVRRAPISLFAATAGSALYRLALQSGKRLKQLLGIASKVKKGVHRRERLGELCYARAIHHQLAARRADDSIRRMKALGNGVPKVLTARQSRELGLARAWLARALRHYRAIVAMGHGSLKRQAEPLFRVASLSMELATHPANRRLVKQRLKYARLVLGSLTSLLRHHPRSRYIELALLAKGAMYYHLGQYAEAIKVLQQARKWYSREAPYAMYLLGWSLYKAGRYNKARVHLRAAARSSRSSKTLVRTARQDMVLVTSHLGNSGRAYKYFRSSVKGRNKGAARRMFRRLARVYLARGKRKPAIRLYRSFLIRWPKHKSACGWMRTLESLLRR